MSFIQQSKALGDFFDDERNIKRNKDGYLANIRRKNDDSDSDEEDGGWYENEQNSTSKTDLSTKAANIFKFGLSKVSKGIAKVVVDKSIEEAKVKAQEEAQRRDENPNEPPLKRAGRQIVQRNMGKFLEKEERNLRRGAEKELEKAIYDEGMKNATEKMNKMKGKRQNNSDKRQPREERRPKPNYNFEKVKEEKNIFTGLFSTGNKSKNNENEQKEEVKKIAVEEGKKYVYKNKGKIAKFAASEGYSMFKKGMKKKY